MASEYTNNYTLDLYTCDDKPNLRDQYNAAMRKIDRLLLNVENQAAAALKRANEIDVEGIQQMLSDMQKVQESLKEAEKALEALDARCGEIEGDVAGNSGSIGSLRSRVDSLSSQLTDLAGQLEELEEQVGGGGGAGSGDSGNFKLVEQSSFLLMPDDIEKVTQFKDLYDSRDMFDNFTVKSLGDGTGEIGYVRNLYPSPGSLLAINATFGQHVVGTQANLMGWNLVLKNESEYSKYLTQTAGVELVDGVRLYNGGTTYDPTLRFSRTADNKYVQIYPGGSVSGDLHDKGIAYTSWDRPVYRFNLGVVYQDSHWNIFLSVHTAGIRMNGQSSLTFGNEGSVQVCYERPKVLAQEAGLDFNLEIGCAAILL